MEEILGDVAIDQKGRMEVSHARPGIMLLTSSRQLLYKNRWASDLCRKIIQSQDGKTANGVLPPAVASLVDEICQILEVRADPKDWEQIQLSRCVDMPHSVVLLCGTALIDQTTAEARIVIVLSEVGIGAWEDTVLAQAKEKFHLTARETTVVQQLLKGWTNRGNRQRNATRGADNQGVLQTHFRKNKHHHAHRNHHEDYSLGVMSDTTNSLTTCGDTDDEWCAQRGGGIGRGAPIAVPPPERRIYQHARILRKGDHNDATAEEVTGPGYLCARRTRNTT